MRWALVFSLSAALSHSFVHAGEVAGHCENVAWQIFEDHIVNEESNICFNDYFVCRDGPASGRLSANLLLQNPTREEADRWFDRYLDLYRRLDVANNYLENNAIYRTGLFAWYLMKPVSRTIRSSALEFGMKFLSLALEKKLLRHDLKAILEETARAPFAEYPMEYRVWSEDAFTRWYREDETLPPGLETVAKVFCRKRSGGRECEDIAPKLYLLASPRGIGGTSIALLGGLKRVYTDPSMGPPLARAALRALRAVEKAERGEAHGENLFRILEEEYAGDLGKVMDVLGIYGTRGANPISMILWNEPEPYQESSPFPVPGRTLQLVQKENLGLSVSLAALFLATGALDMLSPDRTTFSYPEGFTTECRYGKPYHFWMAAALRYQARSMGKSDAALRTATELLGDLYEFNSGTHGRKPMDVYYFKQTHPSPMSAKLHISLRASGIYFMENKLKGLDGARIPIDFDEVVRSTLRSSKNPPRIPLRWYDQLVSYEPVRFLLWNWMMGINGPWKVLR